MNFPHYKLKYVPEKYLEQLQDILNKVEQETGRMFQITINEFGKSDNVCIYIGKYDERPGKIEVYDMKTSYKIAANNVYDKKLKCRNCGNCDLCQQVIEITPDVLKLNGVYDSLQAIEQKIRQMRGVFKPKDGNCLNIQVSKHRNIICIKFGSSIGVTYPIGKWRRLKEV
jgi:hypothetical protein